MLPPGGKATTKVIAPVGNSCPKPGAPSAKRPASAGAIRTARRAIIVGFPSDARKTIRTIHGHVCRNVASRDCGFKGPMGTSGAGRLGGAQATVHAIFVCRHARNKSARYQTFAEPREPLP